MGFNMTHWVGNYTFTFIGTGLVISPNVLRHMYSNVTSLQHDQFIPYLVIYAVAFVLEIAGIVQNIFSLWALYKIPRPLRPLQTMITHLASADLLFLGTGMISTCLVLAEMSPFINTGQWPAPEEPIWCASEIFIDLHVGCYPVPLIVTTCIVLNQLLALTFPLKYKAFISKRRVHVILGISYIGVIVLFLIFHMAILSQEGSCLSHFSKAYIIATSYYLGSLCSVLVLINLILYVGLFIKARRAIGDASVELQERRSGKPLTERAPAKESAKERKLIYTVLMLSVSIVVLWTPAIVTFYLKAFIVSRDFKVDVNLTLFQAITGVVSILNSLVDPLIYGIRLPEVRAGYRSILEDLRKCCRRHDSGGAVTGSGSSKEATKSTSC